MHRLECLEDEGVTRGCGLNAVGEGSVNKVNEEGRWEKSDIGIVRVTCGEKVRPVGEGVRTGEEFSGHMDHFEVKVGKVYEPACLVVVKHLGLSRVEDTNDS